MPVRLALVLRALLVVVFSTGISLGLVSLLAAAGR
jgi:hypothetical protein